MAIAAAFAIGLGTGMGILIPSVALAMHNGYVQRGGVFIEDGKLAPPLRIQNNSRASTTCRNPLLNHGRPIIVPRFSFGEIDR